MRHWYLLAKDLTRPAPRAGSGAAPAFVDGGGPRWSDVTPRSIRVRLFVLGAIEVLPLGGGLGLGFYFAPSVPYAGIAAIGLALSLLLCWLLRHQTPPTAIHAVPSTAANGEDGDDPKANAA